MATFDTTRLLDQVTLKATLPDGRFTNQEILDLASDALISEIAPLMISAREEYYVRAATYSVVAGTASYEVPPRALGGSLRLVTLTIADQVTKLDRIEPEDLTTTKTGKPEYFYMQGDNVVLYPTPDAAYGTLTLQYFTRPNSLVEPTSCAQITAINGNVLTASIPTTWTTADTFDIVRGTSGFSLKGLDLAASQVNPTDITITGTLPSDVAVGDWISLAGEACFPYAPSDAHQLLVQLTVVSCLEALGDQTNLGPAMARAQALKEGLKAIVPNRVQGSPRKFRVSLI